MDGSQKLPQRNMDLFAGIWRMTASWICLALGVAGWMRYVGGVDEREIKINQ
ncbi:hypothetical protein ACNKHV_09570 [Shigella flexneri]